VNFFMVDPEACFRDAFTGLGVEAVC